MQMMTFEEWWDECMGWIEYEPDQYNKGMAKAAWEAAIEEAQKAGMNTLVKAHQIRPRGKSMCAPIPEGYVLVPVEPVETRGELL
jgi:hypothetical protein